ncbi:MAG: hypothetical protein Q4B04_02135 [bacterium]|nr:hypothetical protein [bacterium]
MKNKRKHFGDRKDGRRVRGCAPMDFLAPYIMVERNDASNLFCDSFDTRAVDTYINEKRKEGLKHFGLTHVLLASYVRAVSQRPAINRFISGQKIFARNRIEVNMIVKKNMAINEPETLIKVIFEPTDTAYDVYEKFNAAYKESFAVEENSFDNTAKILNRIPGLIKKNMMWFLKTLDYFGWLPTGLTDVSPFHGSLFITSMGSLGIPPVFHHLYRFGNVPIFMAFGARKSVNELGEDGKIIKKKYLQYTVVTDERICDGFYYASAFKILKRLLKNPRQLDVPPEKVYEDID